MGFLTFLWNVFARVIGFFGTILIEICIFGLLYIGAKPTIGEFWADLLGLVFILWLLIDSFLKLFIGGSASILSYLWSFTQ